MNEQPEPAESGRGSSESPDMTPAARVSGYLYRERSFGSLTQQIVHELGKAIVTRQYSEDVPFPIEADICQKYNASRSIVREAIKVLNAKGLLIARPRKGTYIRPEHDWNLLDPDILYWMLQRPLSLPLLIDFTRVRLAIEPEVAAEAARSGTGSQHDAIAEAIQQLKETATNADEHLEADIRLHLAILEASNNPFFQSMSSMIETALRFSIRFTRLKRPAQRASLKGHKEIVDAILARDGETAAVTSRALMQETLEMMLASGAYGEKA